MENIDFTEKLFILINRTDRSRMNNEKIKLTKEMSDETKILITYLDLSKNRMKVFQSFKNDEILTAKQISKTTAINLNTVGKSLKQLKEKELLILLNPQVRANRKYTLTKKGQKIIKYLK